MAGGKDKVQQQKKDNLYRIQLSQFYKLASNLSQLRAAELWGKRLKIIFSLRHRRLSSSGRCCLVRTKKNILIFWQNSKLQSRDWHISTILLILAFTAESSLALSRWTSWRFLVVTIDPSLDSIWTGCRENWAEMRELPCKQMYSYLPSSAFDMRVNLTSE